MTNWCKWMRAVAALWMGFDFCLALVEQTAICALSQNDNGSNSVQLLTPCPVHCWPCCSHHRQGGHERQCLWWRSIVICFSAIQYSATDDQLECATVSCPQRWNSECSVQWECMSNECLSSRVHASVASAPGPAILIPSTIFECCSLGTVIISARKHVFC